MRPLPPSDLATRQPRVVTVPVDAGLHRFFSAAYDPIFFDRGLEGRLHAPDASFGVLYAAATPRGAFAETFLRTPGRRLVDPGLLGRKALVALRTVREMRFVEMDGPGLAILCATAEITHAGLPYDAPQAWALALHGLDPGFDGIAYSSRHDPVERCFAIFDRAAAALIEDGRQTDLDADWFWELAEVYDVGRSPT